MGVVVQLHGVSKSFGSLRVIDDLSLHLDEGEALGVVGPNGAGKTTMLNLMSGSLKPDSGTVVFKGRDVTRLSPNEHCRAGIARTFQVPRPFGGMTVFENALVGSTFGATKDEAPPNDAAIEALGLTGLLSKANALADSLTLLERKRLELARALTTRPQVLLLDEIGGGLTEVEVQQLVETISGIRSGGVAVLWIEHIVHALLSVVDRLVAMDFGKKVAEGDPRTVLDSPEVRDVYLGVDVE